MEEKEKSAGYWRGRPIEELSKEELIECIVWMQKFYESRIDGWKQVADILDH